MFMLAEMLHVSFVLAGLKPTEVIFLMVLLVM